MIIKALAPCCNNRAAEKPVKCQAYSTGPVVALKSERSQRRWKPKTKGQQSLHQFQFTRMLAKRPSHCDIGSKPTHNNQGCLEMAEVPAGPIRIHEESVEVEIPSLDEAFLDVEICEEEGISLELDILLPSGPKVQIHEESVDITIPAASGSDLRDFEGNEMDWEDESFMRRSIQGLQWISVGGTSCAARLRPI